MKEINKEKVARTAKKVAKALGKTALVFAGGTLVVGAVSLMGCPGPTDAPKEKVHATIGGVDVYLDGVSAGDAATVISYIEAIYTAYAPIEQSNWNARITRINIVTGSTATGSGILNIGKDATGPTVGGLLDAIVAYLQVENGARLVIDTTLWNKNQRTI